MTPPLTAAEAHAAIARLRVDRPLHWDLARRLLAEVLRLRPDLLSPPPPSPERAAGGVDPRLAERP